MAFTAFSLLGKMVLTGGEPQRGPQSAGGFGTRALPHAILGKLATVSYRRLKICGDTYRSELTGSAAECRRRWLDLGLSHPVLGGRVLAANHFISLSLSFFT